MMMMGRRKVVMRERAEVRRAFVYAPARCTDERVVGVCERVEKMDGWMDGRMRGGMWM